MVINGNNNTLDGQGTYQFMKIAQDLNLTLNDITFTKYYAENGGVIYSEGTLTINNAIFNNNNAQKRGGAVENRATLTAINNTFKNNKVEDRGGTICNAFGTVNITECVFENNVAANRGGAVYSHTGDDSPYLNVSYCNFTNNSANTDSQWGGGGALYFTGFLNATGNIFINNHGGYPRETIELMGYYNGILNNNTYESTDINIADMQLNIKDDQYTFNASDDIVLIYNITPKYPYHYKDFETGIRGITLYINDEINSTTKYENITLSNLKPGKYNASYTLLNKTSNTVTFEVIGDSQISTSDESYDYYPGINSKIPLVIQDPSQLRGAINVTVKDNDEYIMLSSYYNVENGYELSTETLADALENLYGTLTGPYTINVTYDSRYAYPSSTEFTLNINKEGKTTITYEILNNTTGNVQINITVLNQITNTPIPNAPIQITGDIIQNTTSGVITDTTLSPGNHTINVKYPETENYDTSEITINFQVTKSIPNINVESESVSKGEKTTITINTNNTPTDGKIEVFIEDNLIATITEFDGQTITINDIDTTDYNIGENTVTVKYTGSEIYSDVTQTATLILNKRNIEITADAASIPKGEKTTITINTNDTITDGKIEVFIEDNLIATITEFNQDTLTISDIDTTDYNIGKNTVTVKYTDNQLFDDTTTDATLTILKRDISLSAGSINITVDVKSTNLTVTFNDTVNDGTINVLLNNNIIGTYNITENTTTADVNIFNTKIPKSPSNITVQYIGSQTYNDAEINTTITTNKAQTTININPIVFNNDQTVNLTANITSTDSNTTINEGKIVFKINGKTLKDENGKVIYAKVTNVIATIEYNMPSSLIEENITLTATYSGTTNYNQASTTITTNITVPPAAPTFTTQDITAKVGETIRLTATINDNDKIINNGKVVFKINGKTIKDSNGKVIYTNIINNQAILEYTLPETYKAKEYNITATFISNEFDRLDDKKTLTITE